MHIITAMKKLILSAIVAAFAVAAQAGSDKATKETASCCSQDTSQTKAECPMMAKDSKGCCSNAKASKTACTKPVLKSPKALG